MQHKPEHALFTAAGHSAVHKIIGGIAAATASFVWGVVPPSENPESREITSAASIVGDPHVTEVDGKPQAEQFYAPTILDRSRDAFSAYMAGDAPTLRSMIAQEGYKSDWINEKAVQSLDREAETLGELQHRFNKLFPAKNIRVHIAQNAIDVAESGLLCDWLNDVDVPAVRAGMKSIAEVLNALDEDFVRQLEIDFVLTGRITDQVKNVHPTGYFWVNDDNKKVIVLDTLDENISITTEHELIHHREEPHEVLANRMQLLTPANSRATISVGDYYKSMSTFLSGTQAVSRDYGRYSWAEDAGVSGEFIAQHNTMLDRSTASEKQMAVLLDLEERSPGATAAYLLDKAPQFYHANNTDEMLYILGAPKTWLSAVTGQETDTVTNEGWIAGGSVVVGALVLSRLAKTRRSKRAKAQ